MHASTLYDIYKVAILASHVSVAVSVCLIDKFCPLLNIEYYYTLCMHACGHTHIKHYGWNKLFEYQSMQ